jgi:hypothetical protein
LVSGVAADHGSDLCIMERAAIEQGHGEVYCGNSHMNSRSSLLVLAFAALGALGLTACQQQDPEPFINLTTGEEVRKPGWYLISVAPPTIFLKLPPRKIEVKDNAYLVDIYFIGETQPVLINCISTSIVYLPKSSGQTRSEEMFPNADSAIGRLVEGLCDGIVLAGPIYDDEIDIYEDRLFQKQEDCMAMKAARSDNNNKGPHKKGSDNTYDEIAKAMRKEMDACSLDPRYVLR